MAPRIANLMRLRLYFWITLILRPPCRFVLPPLLAARGAAPCSERRSEPVAERRDRRVRILVNDHIEQHRLAGRQRLREPGTELGRILDPNTGAAASARDRRMIHRREIDRARIGVEHDRLAMLLVAEDLVVQHHGNDRQSIPDDGLEFGPAMAEAAVAGDADDPP